MPSTALNRTTAALLTNKSGGALAYGDVVILDNANANGVTTTTTGALSTRQIGVVMEPNGIANDASGMVALGGYVPRINLNTAATIGQFLKTHTVAGQATPHSSPQVEGDFGVALAASANPDALLFGSPNGPLSAGAGTDQFGVAVGSLAAGASALTTGVKGYWRAKRGGTITKVTAIGAEPGGGTGSIVWDIWKDTLANHPPTVADTITAAAKPTITTALISEDGTLTGWTTAFNAGDVFGFNIDSISTFTWAVLLVDYTPS